MKEEIIVELKKFEKVKYGYHYTSYSSWLKIKKEGLKPYLIEKPELKPYFNKPIKGIWTWLDNLKGESHIGSVVFQMATKGDMRIMKLKYPYSDKDVLKYDGRKIILPHNGIIGNWKYHKGDKDKAVVVCKAIKAKDIEVVEDYNLMKLLK